MPRLLLLLLLLIQTSSLWAVDLLDLRVFPLFEKNSVAFEGVIVSNSYKSEGTGLRAKISGLRSKWLESGKAEVECDNQRFTVDIEEGEFAGIASVTSLASFSISIRHDKKLLYSENFNFPVSADLIIVSDIDDTILVTEVNSRLKMAYNSMFKDVEERLAVNGTSDLYREISRGATSFGKPHFVYLSSSPAFLSRSLKKFLAHNKFPPGTLVLKKSLTSGDHSNHKTHWLEQIIAKYGSRPVLLFGDSGEKDPAIYRSFVENITNAMPVKGIIIHEITSKSEIIENLLESRKSLLKNFKVPLIYWNKIDDLKKLMQKDRLLK
jgi:hypothetical protein